MVVAIVLRKLMPNKTPPRALTVAMRAQNYALRAVRMASSAADACFDVVRRRLREHAGSSRWSSSPFTVVVTPSDADRGVDDPASFGWRPSQSRADAYVVRRATLAALVERLRDADASLLVYVATPDGEQTTRCCAPARRHRRETTPFTEAPNEERIIGVRR